MAVQAVPELERVGSGGLAHAPITTNQQRLGGTPVIGTYRLPVSRLIDYFAAGYTLEEFLDEYEGTDRATVLAALQRIKTALDEGWLAEPVED